MATQDSRCGLLVSGIVDTLDDSDDDRGGPSKRDDPVSRLEASQQAPVFTKYNFTVSQRGESNHRKISAPAQTPQSRSEPDRSSPRSTLPPARLGTSGGPPCQPCRYATPATGTSLVTARAGGQHASPGASRWRAPQVTTIRMDAISVLSSIAASPSSSTHA